MKSKIAILSTLLFLTACGKPQIVSFTPDVDHSTSVVSEKALAENGCSFVIAGYRAQLNCEERKTARAYYEQRSAIATYLWDSEKIDLKDTAVVKNETSALILQMKRMSATVSHRYDPAVAKRVIELTSADGVQRLFYQFLFEEMKRNQIIVSLKDDKEVRVSSLALSAQLDEATKEAIGYFEARFSEPDSSTLSDPDLHIYRSTLAVLKDLVGRHEAR